MIDFGNTRTVEATAFLPDGDLTAVRVKDAMAEAIDSAACQQAGQHADHAGFATVHISEALMEHFVALPPGARVILDSDAGHFRGPIEVAADSGLSGDNADVITEQQGARTSGQFGIFPPCEPAMLRYYDLIDDGLTEAEAWNVAYETD